MSKTAITSPERAPPSARFPRPLTLAVSSISAVRSAKIRRRASWWREEIRAETEQVFQNLSAVLKAAGKSFDDSCASVCIS